MSNAQLAIVVSAEDINSTSLILTKDLNL